MRRKDREVLGDGNIAKIIEQCTTCHIAMVDDADAGMPYVIPMSFGYSLKTVFLNCIFTALTLARNSTAFARIRMWHSACASRIASKFTRMFIARAGASMQASSGRARPKSSRTAPRNVVGSRS